MLVGGRGPWIPHPIHVVEISSTSCRNAEAGLTIGAVAARTGVSVPVLRAWEQRLRLPQPRAARRRPPPLRRRRRRSHPAGGRGARGGPVARGRHRTRPAAPRAAWSRRRPRRHHLTPASAGAVPTSRSTSSPVGRCWPSATPSRTSASPTRTSPRSPGLPARRGLRAGRPRDGASSIAPRPARSCSPTSTGAAPEHGVHQIAIARRRLRSAASGRSCATPPTSAAALAGWERPDGRFEALWSVEPDVVRLATDLGRQLAPSMRPGSGWRTRPRRPHDPAAGLRRARPSPTVPSPTWTAEPPGRRSRCRREGRAG